MATEGSVMNPQVQGALPANTDMSPAYPLYYTEGSFDPAILKGNELQSFMENLASNRAIPPQAVNEFLAIQYDGVKRAEELSNKVVTAGGIVAIGGLLSAMLMHLLPDLANGIRNLFPILSPEVHQALQQFHDESFNSSATINAIDHLLALLQDAGFFGLIGGMVIPGLEKRKRRAKIPRAQAVLAQRLAGEAVNSEGKVERQQFHMRAGHTVIIGASSVNAPDPLALLFASECEQGDVMLYATQKPPKTNIWTLLQSDPETGNVTTDELDEALLAGGALNCGEYMLLPITGDQYFLPGRKDYDLSPRVVRSIVENIRGFESRHNIPAKRIIIVGDELQEDVSETILPDVSKVEGRSSKERIDTIANVVKDAGDIQIISPTTLVLKEMIKRFPDAKGFTLHGSPEALQKYYKDFYIRLGRLIENDQNSSDDEVLAGYQQKLQTALSSEGNQIYEVGYEIVDTRVLPEVKTKINDPLFVAVVLTQEVYDECLRSGLPKERIIFVPRLVNDEMKRLAEINPNNTDQPPAQLQEQ